MLAWLKTRALRFRAFEDITEHRCELPPKERRLELTREVRRPRPARVSLWAIAGTVDTVEPAIEIQGLTLVRGEWLMSNT